MPTVSTLPFIKPHFHNNAGSPANGYKLYSYDSTTQDAIPLYKDPAGSVEYTNPIILNSRGEPDGTGIYLDDDKVYKLILKTENDTPVWTVNAVQGVGGNGGVSVPIIPLPGHTVLGNATDNYGDAYPVEIVDIIADNTNKNLVPSVGAVVYIADKKLNNSGNNTYNGNLDIDGSLDVNSLTIQGVALDDIYVNEDGHNARSIVGNKDAESGKVEDIPLVDSLASGSNAEIPSVLAVKNYVDTEVTNLENQISQITDSAKVKVSDTDIANYLEDKLVEGNRVQITKIVDGGEEKLQLDLNIDDLKDISYVFQAVSQVAGFDTVVNDAIYAGFDSTIVNYGNAFNLADGKFTALDSGYYHFDISALINQVQTSGTSACNMYLKHFNSAGTELASVMGFGTTPASSDQHPTYTIACSSNFHMAIDDYVCVVFNITGAGALQVNKVAFGGYSLDSASGVLGSGTPNRLAIYDPNGDLNPAQRLVYDGLYNLLLGSNTTVSVNIAEGVAIGRDNAVNAQDSVILGRQNSTTGGSSAGIAYAIGRQNNVAAPEGMAVGFRNNIVTAGETMVVGMESSVDGSEMIALGQDIDTDGAASVVMGQAINASNLTSTAIYGQNVTLNNVSSKTIIGHNISGTATIPSAASMVVGCENDYISLFGKYVDQFGNYGVRGRFLGFDANQKLKVTNEVSDIKFITDAGVEPVEGQLSWNEMDKTLNVGLANGSVLQVGQEEVVYAVNQTGRTIANGEVVYVSGSQGNRVVVQFAQATTQPSTQVFIAVATANINNNKMGYFTRFGLVREINTAAYLEGDILWVSTTAGQMTSTQPAKPYSQIAVAIVTRAHAQQGTIMVSPYVVPRLSQLTDVSVAGATDGQALVYQASTGLWIPGTATGGVSDGKIKVTAGDTADYAGTKFTSSDNSVDITVNAGSIDLTVDVGNNVSKFSTNPTSSGVSGLVPFGGNLEFGNWVIANNNIVAPISGTHQINVFGKVLFSSELDSAMATSVSGNTVFRNSTERLVAWNMVAFGQSGWAGQNTYYTFNESGKVQINLQYTLRATTTAGAVGNLVARHYNNSGSLLAQYYLPGKITGLSVDSTYERYQLAQVLSVSAGDTIKIFGNLGSQPSFIDDTAFSCSYLSNTNNTAGTTTPITLHQKRGGSVISHANAYVSVSNLSGFTPFCLSKVFEVESGDQFSVIWTKYGNTTAITDVVMSGAIMQSNTVGGGGGGTVDSTLDGLQSYALIMTNSSIFTGHTSDQGSTYTSARVIPAAHVEANYISCFATQIGTYYGLRMGIYTPGPSGDTLIAQTDNLTTTPSTGIITLPLLYDAAGNALTSPITLSPNTSYMLAAVIKANACNFASYTGISTNPPNHFGRKDDWNAPAPTNLMQTTASYSQTNQFIWMSVSK